MKLKDWLARKPSKKARITARRELAASAGVTENAVKHWEQGSRQPDPVRLSAVVAYTEGQVTAHELRPDLFRRTASGGVRLR